MLPMNPVRFVKAVPVLAAALTVCGLQLYGQRPDPRMLMGAAARAVAAKAAAQRDATTPQVLTPPPPTAVGTFVTFDVPGAVNGTSPASINNGGAITGSYGDNIGSGLHGFIRDANGTFVTFDVPGAVNGTIPFGINNDGATAGYYADNLGSGAHGFVRAANGTFATFDIAGAIFFSTSAINARGEVAGHELCSTQLLTGAQWGVDYDRPSGRRQWQLSLRDHPRWADSGSLL